MVVELRSNKDDVLRGLGQPLRTLAHDYDMALPATYQSIVERLDAKVFQASGIGLAAVDKGELKIVVEPKNVKFWGEI